MRFRFMKDCILEMVGVQKQGKPGRVVSFLAYLQVTRLHHVTL